MQHQLITKKNIIACAMTCAMVTGMCAMPGCANKNSTEIDSSNATENTNTNNNANNTNNANGNANGNTNQASSNSGSQSNSQGNNDQQGGSSGTSSDSGSQGSSGGQASSGGSSSGSTQQASGGESSAQPASGGSSETPSQRWVEDYTTVWVEDSAAYSEQVPIYGVQELSICNICGADCTGNTSAHGQAHMLAGEGGGYHSEVIQTIVGYDTVTYPATGHYETVVSGGHWE